MILDRINLEFFQLILCRLDSGKPLTPEEQQIVLKNYIEEAKKSKEEVIEETIKRADAYCKAGADCVYPIGVLDLETIKALRSAMSSPWKSVHIVAQYFLMNPLYQHCPLCLFLQHPYQLPCLWNTVSF